MKIINSKKKKIKLLTKEQQESYENAKICYICKEKIENKYLKDKKYRKGKDHCHYTEKYSGASYSICKLKFFIMDLTMIIILSQKSQQKNFKNNLLV